VLWEAGARSVWEIQSQEEENTLNIALFHRKANMSKRFSPQGYQIEYQDDLPYQISWHNPKDVVEFVERMSTGDRILDLLREGKQEFTVICQTLDITPNTARVTLYRLKKKGLVVKLGEDTWGLATR
jgi:DNA-binding transcriptional ArsR family regulator